MFWRSNGVENQWSMMPLNRLHRGPLSNLLIQYEALEYLGFGLIALTLPISVCLCALTESKISGARRLEIGFKYNP